MLVLAPIAWLGLAVLAAGAIAAPPPARPAGSPLRIETLRFSQPFPARDGGEIFDIAQAADGAVWLASRNHLQWWDGFELHEVAVPASGTTAVQVFNLEPDGAALWIGFGGRASACGAVPCDRDQTGQGGVARIENRRVGPVLRAADGGNDEAFALAAQAETLWIGTRAGLLRLRAGTFTRFSSEAGLDDPLITAIGTGADGSLWVGTRQGIQEFRDGRFTATESTSTVTQFAGDQQGTVWAATHQGLWWKPPRGAWQRLVGAQGLPATHLRSVVTDGKGTVWTASYAGLLQIVDGVVSAIPLAGSADPRLVVTATDDEGGVWVGTRAGGVWRGYRSPISPLGREEGLPLAEPAAVRIGRDDSVWTIDNEGHLVLIRAGRAERNPTPIPLDPQATAVDARGALWVAAEQGGVWTLAPDAIAPVQVDGLVETNISALLFIDGSRRLLVAGGASLSAYTIDPAAPTHVAQRTAIELDARTCPGPFVAMAAGPDATVWMVSQRGVLGRLVGSRLQCSDPLGGVRSGAFNSVAVDETGAVWIADLNGALGRKPGGLLRQTPGHLASLGQRQGLPCDAVSSVLSDGRGHLWLACPQGIARLELAQVDAQRAGTIELVRPLLFNVDSGMRSHATSPRARPALALDRQGRLWVATLLGMHLIQNPDHFPFPPPPRITSIATQGTNNDGATPETVAGQTISVRGNAIALTLPMAARVRYQFQTDGEPANESTATGLASWVAFSPRKSGSYRITARVANAFGLWSQSAVVQRLDVAPPLGRRPSTWLIAIAGAALLLLSLTTLRARQAAARTAVIQRERERLARDLHDHLGQDFASLGYHLEMLSDGLQRKPDEVPGILTRTLAILKHAQDDTRRAIWQLRAQELTGGSLRDGLRALSQQGHAGLQCTLEVQPDISIDDAQIESEFLQVAREALTNAEKHAAARRVLIELGRAGNDLRLRVSDDGRGFTVDPERHAAEGHFGVLGMHERLRRLGGTLLIDSQAGAGTLVEARVPLTRRPA